MPVAREVLEHARVAPRRVALALAGVASEGALAGDVTYRRLADLVLGAAAGLAQGVDGRRVDPGAVVAILPAGRRRALSPATLETAHAGVRWARSLVALLAVDLVGATPLLCPEGWSDEQRDEVLDRTRPDHRVPAGPTHSPPPRLAVPLPAARPDDLAWAGFTSGSTGRPRAVVRSRASWTDSFDTVTALCGATGATTVLVPGDLATSLYCFGALHALSIGATVRPAPLPGEVGVAALASDVLHVTPAQLGVVLDALEAADPGEHPTAGRPRVALVGGADLPAAARARAERLGVRVVAYYGAAELSFVAVDTDGTGLRPFPRVEVDVRSEPDTPRGVVWVRSPWLATGYLADADGPLRRTDGWASVGDLAGPRAADAPLVLRGRGSEAIAVGAATVLPEDVESVLVTDPGVTDVVVLGIPHARWGEVVAAVLVLATSVEGGSDPDDAHLLARLETLARATLAPAQRPRRWFVAAALPRTDGGKVARAAVADALGGYRRLRSHPRR